VKRSNCSKFGASLGCATTRAGCATTWAGRDHSSPLPQCSFYIGATTRAGRDHSSSARDHSSSHLQKPSKRFQICIVARDLIEVGLPNVLNDEDMDE